MSAPERFQVGDTVRCVRGYEDITEGGLFPVLSTTKYDTLRVDDTGRWWDFDRFVLVSRPTPSALDPFAWDLEAFREAARWTNSPAWDEDIVAWSRFCYWCASVNLAAHFLPTQPAARTRASNGRDVPAATVLVELPVDVVEWWARPTYHFYVDRNQRMAAACRRALGGGA
jgi:hypothetical protein